MTKTAEKLLQEKVAECHDAISEMETGWKVVRPFLDDAKALNEFVAEAVQRDPTARQQRRSKRNDEHKLAKAALGGKANRLGDGAGVRRARSGPAAGRRSRLGPGHE
jgi:hypothetical protein